MTTKKHSKKSQKKSAADKSGGKKATASKSKKGTTKKATTKKGASKKGASKTVAAATASAALKGNCLGLVEAGAIVEHAVVSVGGIDPGDYDIDKKMEQMGVITPNQCTLVKQMILNDVRAFPCKIDDGDISVEPSTVARALRDQVKDNAAL